MRTRSIVSALAALLWAGAFPAAAQVVVGGSEGPDVQVNWSVIDQLGPAPTLPSLLGGKLSPAVAAAASVPPGDVVYRPFGHKPAKPTHKVAAEHHERLAHPAKARKPGHKAAAAP